MQEYLITLSPRYKKLKNPILKRTIGRVASLRQASYLGGFKPEELVNKLRVHVGQEPIKDNVAEDVAQKEKPNWADKEATCTLNATELLNDDKNPLAVMNKELKKLNSGEILLIKSDFMPLPLIDEVKKKGLKTITLETDKENWVDTYIQKS
jgi:TusA-related sulfurtransferase